MHAPADLNKLDPWFDWISRGRHGGNSSYDIEVKRRTLAYADRVLDGARLAPGARLIDVGCGDGLVALRAIERVGASLQVQLCDISAPLLDLAQHRARECQVDRQCAFFHCGAEDLAGIADASADGLTTRSVLAYVGNKRAAMAEFCRVLRPGGVLSIAEPIFRDEAINALSLRKAIAEQKDGGDQRFAVLLQRWMGAQFPDTIEGIGHNPLTNFCQQYASL